MERKNAWKKYGKEDLKTVFDFSEAYRQFISCCKTERECVKEAVRLAKERGYRDLQDVIAKNETLSAGDKVYAVNKEKAVVLYHIGKEPLEKGMNILGAHIDSPRLDIKQVPLYEDSELVLMDTHYYGGIKKYQWVALPLALHGVVALKDGSVVEVCIGEDASDPVVGVSDLLIHLAGEQMSKKADKVIEGENLDILVGSMPSYEKEEDGKDAKEAVKKDYEERREIMDASPIHVAIAGRMMFKRVMGKASFCNIQDLQGNIQVYVARDAIGTDSYADFKKSDIGDIFGLEGFAFRTRTGEISIHADDTPFQEFTDAPGEVPRSDRYRYTLPSEIR